MIDKILLFPYWLTLRLRKLCYDKGWKKSSEAEVPTISVGNITVGGTGKTPHTEMIRGYKRTSKGFQKVPWDAASADLYGDEPVQIAGKLPIVTVAVDKDRVEGCRFLCHPVSDKSLIYSKKYFSTPYWTKACREYRVKHPPRKISATSLKTDLASKYILRIIKRDWYIPAVLIPLCAGFLSFSHSSKTDYWMITSVFEAVYFAALIVMSNKPYRSVPV